MLGVIGAGLPAEVHPRISMERCVFCGPYLCGPGQGGSGQAGEM